MNLLHFFRRQKSDPTVVCDPQANKPLSLVDATSGMAFEMEFAKLQAAAMTAQQDSRLFVENLRLRYNAPEDEWTLRDWAEGFVRVENNDAENHP